MFNTPFSKIQLSKEPLSVHHHCLSVTLWEHLVKIIQGNSVVLNQVTHLTKFDMKTLKKLEGLTKVLLLPLMKILILRLGVGLL